MEIMTRASPAQAARATCERSHLSRSRHQSAAWSPASSDRAAKNAVSARPSRTSLSQTPFTGWREQPVERVRGQRREERAECQPERSAAIRRDEGRDEEHEDGQGSAIPSLVKPGA